MLNSCSSGVTVVNIDNGFSAAVTATLVLKKIEEGSHKTEDGR
jgi:NCAIR mutase (PurE)-related protein